MAQHGTAFFNEFLLVLVIATVVALTFERFRLPPVLGFLLAGVVIGPRGLSLITDTGRINQLAELGTVMLMLTIGIEFSFARLRGMAKIAILGGAAQIASSIVIMQFMAHFVGWSLYQGFVLGAVMALSSTAIVLKYLIDRGELDTQHGKIAVAILVFQDLAFVPLMILVQTLGKAGGDTGATLVMTFTMALFFTVLLFALFRFALGRILHWVAKTKNREVFLLTVIVICFGSAWLANAFGFSMAIGAFFAGLMFANTPYGDEVSGNIIPFRHVFVSLFFVSIGLLFDVSFMLANMPLILLVVTLVLVINFVVTTGITISLGYLPRVAILSGLILAQIGEFSFLLLKAAMDTGAIEPFMYQLLLSAAFLTIFATPFLFRITPLVVRACEVIPFFGTSLAHDNADTDLPKGLKNHVIICGYGHAGKDLALALSQEKIPHIILDMNPVNVQTARKDGSPAIYGDGVNEEVMRRAGINTAKAVVASFGDSIGVMQLVRVAQRLNPGTNLIVRTRFEDDVATFYDAGVDVVVMEELETSLELNRILLESFQVPEEKIEAHLETIRARKELAIEKAIFKGFDQA